MPDDQDDKTDLKRRAIEAMDFVRWVAKEQSSILLWSKHAKQQMEVREIYVRDVEAVLRNGDVLGDPGAGQLEGEVSIDISFRPKGMREIVVATIVVKDRKTILLKTVMWKDER